MRPRSRRIQTSRTKSPTANLGRCTPWLRDNLYQHGSKFVPNDLVERATGTTMHMRSYSDYLRQKYGALYLLPA
jgi:carboxypeptidase Taq